MEAATAAVERHEALRAHLEERLEALRSEMTAATVSAGNAAGHADGEALASLRAHIEEQVRTCARVSHVDCRRIHGWFC